MKSCLALVLVCVLVATTTFAESSATVSQSESPKAGAQRLTTFDLNFPGGTPQQLVTAIEKAMGRPLNAIIPVEYADWKLPPLRMSHITASELFRALEQATVTKYANNSVYKLASGFRTTDAPPAQTDDSVWTFSATNPPPLPSQVRFHFLTPYLEGGLTVDDITTAIQTAWRMSGANPAPTLSFHKETNLLIAAGDPVSLQVIDEVLSALRPMKKEPKPAMQGGNPLVEKKS